MHPFTGTPVAGLNVSRAYDAIASEYDAQVRGDDWMRHVLHAHYFRVFQAGDRVLDVGCGTGIDAIALAHRGVRVVGIDASSRALEQFRSKLTGAGLADLVETHVLRIEDLSSIELGGFDGLISAFASLNSLPDLSRFADDAARLVRPGGRLVLHMLNRFSLWEWLGAVARRDLAVARDVGRLSRRTFSVGGIPIEHSVYFGAPAYHEFFARDFALCGLYGLGALRPPHTVRRIPGGLVRTLEWLDIHSRAWPLVKDAGRFFVLDLQRLPT